MKADERRFIKGRLTYGGGARCPFPSCVVVFRPPKPVLEYMRVVGTCHVGLERVPRIPKDVTFLPMDEEDVS
jgi:hypothetical protein